MGNLAGVDSAGYSRYVLSSVDKSPSTVYQETKADFRPKNSHAAKFYDVSPGYFGTAGTPLLAGREFTLQDDAKSPRVAIVNQTFAQQVLGTGEVVGRRFRPGPHEFVQHGRVVGDGKY